MSFCILNVNAIVNCDPSKALRSTVLHVDAGPSEGNISSDVGAAVVFQTLAMTEWNLARASKPSEVQLPSVPPQADRLPQDCPLQSISTCSWITFVFIACGDASDFRRDVVIGASSYKETTVGFLRQASLA